MPVTSGRFKRNMAKTWFVFFTLLCLQKVPNATSEDEATSVESFSQTGTLTSCGKGWFSFGHMCYRMGGKKKVGKMAWGKASERCQEEYNANLVTVHSQELQDFLTTFLLLSVRANVWIGLHDRVNESEYHWDDGSPFEYTNWEPTEPSGVNLEKEDCTEMIFRSLKKEGKTGNWNDISCDDEKEFICQKEKGKQSKRYSDPRYCSAEVGGGWSFEASCFNFVSEMKTWSEAEEYCSTTFNGHLVTVPDFPVNLFLNYILRNQEEHMWIGIKLKDGSQQRWSSGWYVSYENWSEDEEEFIEGTCAFRNTEGQWSTIACNRMLPFVCEYSTARPPVLKPPVEGSFCPMPEGWRDLGGELCYYFETKASYTWYKANFYCMRADEEFAWLDGSPLDFAPWDSNEPNTEMEKCVEMKSENMKWNDIDCEQAKGFICSIQKISPNGTNGNHQSPGSSCLSGFSFNALIGVMFCVLFVAVLMGVVMYYFRLCERGYQRVRKTSGTKLQSPSALDKKTRYRSEIVVTDDDPNYENMA